MTDSRREWSKLVDHDPDCPVLLRGQLAEVRADRDALKNSLVLLTVPLFEIMHKLEDMDPADYEDEVPITIRKLTLAEIAEAHTRARELVRRLGEDERV